MDAACAADSWVWLYVLLAVAISTSLGFAMCAVKAALNAAWACARRPGAAPRDTAQKEEESHEPVLQEPHEPVLQESLHGTPENRGRVSHRSNTAPPRLERNAANRHEPTEMFPPW
jgi:hypothetical protein